MKATALVLLAIAAITSRAEAKLQLAALIGDHMVLQQDQPVVVWGKAEKGQAVKVSLAGEEGSSKADPTGKWKVVLPPLKAGGPYEMTVTAKETLTVHDVLVGEVWLGSGQSNMEFAMAQTHDADKEIPAANFPSIRLFTVERATAFAPAEDVVGSWKVCQPETARHFSAVAYHFGKNIHQALKVPVGLIASDWGGTPGEDWVPREALDQDVGLASLAREWEKNPGASSAWMKGMDFDLWVSDIRLVSKDGKATPAPLKGKGGAGLLSHNESAGSKSSVEASGKTQSGSGKAVHYHGLMKGGGWSSASIALSLGGGTVDLSGVEAVEFYAKGLGSFVPSLSQPDITDGDNYAGEDFKAGKEWTLVRVPLEKLKQGGWGSKKPFARDQAQNLVLGVQVPYWPEVPSIVYNGMIAPLTPYKIRGVLWYQGESNAGRPSQYHVLLSTLIQSWRKVWDEGDFPFLIVQLPNFMEVRPEPSESGWAELREAQLQTLDVPKTGLVTTIDLGEANNIHPKNKTEVGRRLSLTALGDVYGKQVVYSGPSLGTVVEKGGKVTLSFKNAEGGLVAQGGKELKGFSVAGKDHQFHWAKAKVKGSTVTVWSDQVPAPAEVRYAWADNPVCNLYNKGGLPATPFRATISTEKASK